MDELMLRLMELSRQGYKCSQMLLLLALEQEDTENPQLISAMGGLTGGLGFCGKVCGALTGGCALLGLYLCQGEADQAEDSRAKAIIKEYVDWFYREVGGGHNGVECLQITGYDAPAARPDVCPALVKDCYEKAMGLLFDYGILE